MSSAGTEATSTQDAPADVVGTTAPTPAELHARAVAVVGDALDAGDVEVALRVLAMGDPGAARRRRRWAAAGLAGVAVLALIAGVLAFGAMNGGTSGEDAPEPLAFGELDPTPAAGDTAAGDAGEVATTESATGVDPGTATDPAVAPAEVLGTSITATPGASTGSAAVGSASATRPSATSSASSTAGRTATPATPTGGAPSATAAPPSPAPTAAPTTVPRGGALDGTWSAAAAQAGYRISKTWTLAGNTEEVVGRTSRVAGSLTVAADRLTAATVAVDMGSVDSANLIRDAAFREQLLATAANPEARFELTSVVDISGRPAAGQVFAVRAAGRLKIRGVVRDVVVDLQTRQNGASIQVIGSIPVNLADYGVPNPSFALASVSDRATIEFSVAFNRS